MTDDEREQNRSGKKAKYNLRWFVEIVISAKAKYGDSVMCKKLESIQQEIKTRVCTYNEMLQVGKEATMNV